MSTVELNHLEYQVDQLIDRLETIQTENQLLRVQLMHSNRDKFRIKDKNQKAVMRIKKIVSQLKEELV